MSNSETVKALVGKLGEKKTDFLYDVKNSVKATISSKSASDCLTINQLWLSGGVKSTYEPEASKAYFKCLVAFLNKNKLDGYNLDSKLTPEVVKIVTQKFNDFYSSNATELAKPLAQQLIKDQVFAQKLAETIVETTKGPLPETVKKQLTTHLVNILQDSVGVDIGHTIGTAASAAISKAVSVAVAMNISTTVIAAVLKQVAFALKGVIAKVLATTAFKTTIVAFLKKLMAIKIVTALAAIVAAVPVLGPAIATAPLWVIVAPVLAGFIYYQVSNLPENMGEKVSEAVCKELNGKFEQLNTDVVTQILENFSKDTLGTLVKDIAKEVSQNITFRNSLNEIE